MVKLVLNTSIEQDFVDNKLKEMSCVIPFTRIEILRYGKIVGCCFKWMPVEMGNLLTDTVDEIFNNANRLRVQNNLKKGIFNECTDHCHHLSSFLLNKSNSYPIIPIKNFDSTVKNSKIHIQFSYDNSCNLQCPSCRTDLVLWDYTNANDVDGQIIKHIHERVKELVSYLLDRGNRILLQLTGSGDPFASPLYWNYLQELASGPVHENLSIQLDTNGILMTKANLIKIKSLWGHITRVNISVDAVNESTYKIVRKNGNFKKLQKNLTMFDALVIQGNFPHLENWQTNFIVQNDNYAELEEYVKWQLSFKSKPIVSLSAIDHWWHLTDDKFKSMAVWNALHPERNKLIAILKNPIFQNKQIRGNISNLILK